MLNQLIVTSATAGARRPGAARRIALAKPPQFHIKNKVTLKGYLGKDAESFATKQQKTFVTLSLATASGYKDKQSNEWVNHTEWHRIIVFGKAASRAKDLKKGDYVEIEGGLHSTEFESITDGVTVKRRSWEIRASIVRKLEHPEPTAASDIAPAEETDEVAA